MKNENDASIEAKRLAIEIMAYVPWWRRTLIEKILVPAGVPREVFQDYLRRIDPLTGKRMTKRAAAPGIIEAMEQLGKGGFFVRKVIEIGADWTDFHLHEREHEARATVQKAKSFRDHLVALGEQEREHLEKEALDQQERLRREKKEALRRGRRLLMMQFDDLVQEQNAQQRGLKLEPFLDSFFRLFEIPSTGSFRRNESGEQIDGGFRWNYQHYLMECKWLSTFIGIHEIDAFKGKIDRSGDGAKGLFVSVNGFSPNVVSLLKQNPSKNILLSDGYDLRFCLESEVSFGHLLDRKTEALRFRAEPYLSARQL